MMRELSAFLSVFCVLSLVVHVNEIAYLFGLGALTLFAVDLLTTHSGGKLRTSKKP